MKLIIVAGLLFVSFFGCGGSTAQDEKINKVPEEIIERTNAYLMQRMSIVFFRRLVSFESAAADSPYYHVSYKLKVPGKPYIDEPITITTDFSGNIDDKIPVKGIPLCTRDSSLCNFNIDEEAALQIAEENFNSQEIKKREPDFKWNDKFNRYVWEVRGVISESRGSHGYRGKGETIIINPGTGEVLDKNEWNVR